MTGFREASLVGHIKLIAAITVGMLLASSMLAPVTMDLGTEGPLPSTTVSFTYTINATSSSNPNWTASESGSASVGDTDRDKFIVNSTLNAPANDTIYSLTITVNGTSYPGDSTSDYGIAKSPTIWAWMVGRELHAGSTTARVNADHTFTYEIEAAGTQDVPLAFNYTINATGRERYTRTFYLNESVDYSWRQHYRRRHERPQACLSNASFTLVGYYFESLTHYGFVHAGEYMSPPERPVCLRFTAHVHGAGTDRKHHYNLRVHLYGEFVDTNARRDWYHVQTGSGNVLAGESPKFIANYTGQVGTGLPNSTVMPEHTLYRVSVDNSLVIATMDSGGNLRVITNHTAPWSSSLLGSSSVNATESVKTIATSSAVAPNNITTYTAEITVNGTRATTYEDLNNDGTIEAGLFYAWLNDPDGNVLYASVLARPPVAVIDTLTPTLSQEGETVSFSGHGTDPGGGNITNITWRSHADGVLSTNASFNTTALSARTHLISLQVRNDDGLWSPPATRQIRVNQKPVAVIAAAAGTGLNSNNRRVAAIGENLTFVGYGFDTDGSVVSYEWNSSVDGVLSDQPSFSNSSLSLGQHIIRLRVRDNDGAYSETANISVEVKRHPVILIHGYLSTPSIWHRMKGRLNDIGFETFLLDLRRPTDVRGAFTLNLNNANYTPNQDFAFFVHIVDLKLFDINVPLPLPDYLQSIARAVASMINGDILSADGVHINMPRLSIPFSIEDYLDAAIGLTLKFKNFRLSADPFGVKTTLYLGIDVSFNVSAEFGSDTSFREFDMGTLQIDSGPVSGSIKVGVRDLLSSSPQIGLQINLGFPLFRMNLANADIKSYSQDLADFIAEVQRETGLSKVDVVGHDMGGLVARWYGLTTVSNPMRKLVLLGVPNHGFSGAKYLPMIIKALITWITGYIPVVGVILGQILNEAFTYVLGEAIEMMIPHSSFLRALNGNNKGGSSCISVGGGACDHLDLSGTDLVPTWTEHYVIRGDFGGPTTISHYHVCVDYYFRVSCYEVPWTDRGDLMVTLNSAKLDGVMRDTVPIWHFWLPYAQSVFHKVRDFLFDDPTLPSPSGDQPIVYNSIPVLEATEMLPRYNGSIGPNQTKSHGFTIEPGALSFSLSVSVEEGEHNATLVDPNSNVITPASANNVTINYTKANGTLTYEIQNPTAGQWTAQVTGSNGSGGPTNYSVFGRFNTNIVLSVDLGNVTFSPGSTIAVQAMFRDGANPVAGATVIASIEDPANVITNITLYDDGAHGDLNASDGVYGNTFTGTTLEGGYHVNVTGSFVKAGSTVTRIAPTDFIVERNPDLTLNQEDISFEPQAPTHSDCVEMSALIHNIGDGDATNVDVLFYDGDPVAGGLLIETTRIFVPVGVNVTARVPWCAVEGQHDIYVLINPNGEFVERNYSNNQASKPLSVSGDPPVPDAGPDITATVGSPVFFDGTATTDDAGIVNYSWDVNLAVDNDTDGVLYNDFDLIGPNPVLSTGYPAAGIYLASLNVIDKGGNQAGDVVVVRVVDDLDTTAPTADAGSDLIVGAGDEVTLDASGSSDDFGISSYEWDIDTAVDSDEDGISDNDQDHVGRTVVLPEGFRSPGIYIANLIVDDAAGNGPANDSVRIVVVSGNISVPCDLDTRGGFSQAISDLCDLRGAATDNETRYAIDAAIDRILRSTRMSEVQSVNVTPSTGVSVKLLTDSRLTLEIPWNGTTPDDLILKFENSMQDISIPFRDTPDKPYLLFPNGPFRDENGRRRAVEPAGALRDGELWVPVQDACYWERNLFRIHDYGDTWNLMKLDIRFFDASRDFEVWIDGYHVADVDLDFLVRDRFATDNTLHADLGNGTFEHLSEAAAILMDAIHVECEGVASMYLDLNLTWNESFDIRVTSGNRLLLEVLNASLGSNDTLLLDGTGLPGGKLPNPIHVKILRAGTNSVVESVVIHTTCDLVADTDFGSVEVADVSYHLIGGIPEDPEPAIAILNRLTTLAEAVTQFSLAEARSTEVRNATYLSRVNSLLTASEEAMTTAYEEWAMERYDVAIARFGEAWWLATEAKRIALL